MSELAPRWRPSVWRRLGPAERAVALALVTVAIGGLLLIADGLYIRATAVDTHTPSGATSIQSSIRAALDGWRRAAGPTDPAVTFLPSPLANAASPPR